MHGPLNFKFENVTSAYLVKLRSDGTWSFIDEFTVAH